MKKLFKNANSAIICIIEIIVGVLLLLNPHAFISYILIIAGAFIALSGVISLIKYFASTPEVGEESQGLSKALVSLTLGIFLVVKNGVAATFTDLLAYVFGAAILYIGYTKLQKAVDKMRKKQFFLVALIAALITVVCAVIVFTLKGNALWLFLGISLIAEAVIDIADIIAGAVTSKKADKEAEAEVKAEEAPKAEEEKQ